MTPAPNSTGRLGISRSSGRSGYAASSRESFTPARTEAIAFACSATSALEPTAWPPVASASRAAFPSSRSETSTGSPMPRARALAMFPAPMSPSCTKFRLDRASGARPTSARPALALVEEALLDQTGTLLGRDVDVARGEQEHLVGDALHAPVERVGEAGGEIDEALREVGIGALQVEDDRDRVLELVGDLLGVVEALGHHEVDLQVPPVTAAVGLHRAQDAGLAATAARRVVGEDVVEVVAPAPGQAADVGPLAVVVLQLRLGLAGRSVTVPLAHGFGIGLLVLCEAEVDESTVPGVA